MFKEKESYEKKIYADIVFDYSYLENPEDLEDEIQSNVSKIE